MTADALQRNISFFRAQLESWPLPDLFPRPARLLAAGEVLNVDPPEAVVSTVRPTQAVTDIRAYCDLGNFVSSPDAATEWLAHSPQGEISPSPTTSSSAARPSSRLAGWHPEPNPGFACRSERTGHRYLVRGRPGLCPI